MNRMISVVATTVVALSLAACAAAAPPTPVPTPTVAATATAAAAPAANGAAPAGTRMNGVVQSVTGSSVTLANGTSFTISSNTRFLHAVDVGVSDLQSGDLVAVTAKKQDDGTLLASVVNVFPKSIQANIRQGQSPMAAGNLMTNAAVDTVANGGFTVKYPDGTAQVKLAPDAKVTKLADGTLADVKVGSTVLALVVNGVARSVTIR